MFQYSKCSTQKAAAAAKSYSSILYIQYNERSTTYANALPPPHFWRAQIKDLDALEIVILVINYEGGLFRFWLKVVIAVAITVISTFVPAKVHIYFELSK